MFEDLQKQGSGLNNNLVQPKDQNLIDDFEILDKEKANTQNANSSNSAVGSKNNINNSSKKAEDIFSNTDSFDNAKNILKPGGTSPKEPITNYKELIKEVDSVQSSRIRPHYFLIGLIIVILILGSAGFYIYKKFLTGVNQTGEILLNNKTENTIATNTNDNSSNSNLSGPVDTDGDGISDQEENSLKTNPNSPDSDGDSLFDYDEVRIYHTDPLNKDTDGDGYLDGEEVNNGYNPNGSGKLLDFSLITNGQEQKVLENPNLDTSNWKDFSSISNGLKFSDFIKGNINFKYPSNWTIENINDKIKLSSQDKKSSIEIDIRDNKLELDLVDWFLTQKDYPSFSEQAILINNKNAVLATSSDSNWKAMKSVFIDSSDKVYSLNYFNVDNANTDLNIFNQIILSFNIK